MAAQFPMNYAADPDDMARAALFRSATNPAGPPAVCSPAKAAGALARTSPILATRRSSARPVPGSRAEGQGTLGSGAGGRRVGF